jgi:hypothetical protein
VASRKTGSTAPGKETALSVLDEMVFEAAGESPLNSD